MITKGNYIWGWRTSLETTPLPHPFESIKKKADVVYNPDNKTNEKATAVHSVIKAALIQSALEDEAAGLMVDYTDMHKGVAVGTRSNSDGSETVYVEKLSKNRDCTDIIKYNPSTGDLSGSFYDNTTLQVKPYRLKGKGGTDGTAIFLAMFSELMSKNSSIANTMHELKVCIRDENYDQAYVQALLLSELVYKELTQNDRVKCQLDDAQELRRINKMNIDKGTDGPSKGKVTYGKFRVLKVGGKSTPAEAKKELDAALKKAGSLPFVRREKDFTTEEIAMIPEISSIHVVSNEERFILSEIVDTFNDERNSIKTLMLLGMSSSGKSHLAETLAARMKRAYSAPLTCTPNMDETTLLGTTLPVIDGGSSRDGLTKEDNELLDKLYSANETEIPEILQFSLGLPNADVILFNPEGAYEQITGSVKEGVTSSEVIRLSQIKMGDKINQLVRELPKGDGVRYMYYKSPLVRAIENGWMIEIQEFNVCKEAAIFASLNNVFDKEANGILETPYGQVLRHPDFRAVYTANPDYAGCRDPHQSVIARSDMIVTMNNPASNVMKDRIKNRMKFEDDELLDNLIETFIAVTNRARDISCNGEATMRELYRFANAISRNVDPEMAIENYVINAITRDEEDKAELKEAANATALMMM